MFHLLHTLMPILGILGGHGAIAFALVKAALPVRYELRESPFSVILDPVYPQGAKKTRGSGVVRNQLRDVVTQALGFGNVAAGDLTDEQKNAMALKINLDMKGGAIQVVKGGQFGGVASAEELAHRIADAKENYLALFGAPEETAEQTTDAFPEKAFKNAVGRIVRALDKHEATDEEQAPLIAQAFQALAERFSSVNAEKAAGLIRDYRREKETDLENLADQAEAEAGENTDEE